MLLKQGSCTELKIDGNKLFIVLFLFIFSMKCALLKKILVAGELPFNLSSLAFGLRRKRSFIHFLRKQKEYKVH